MPKYENSVIYKLCHCNDLENKNIYVGSTTNLKNRKNQHKTKCNNENSEKYNLLVYQFIRDNGGWNEWVMIPIEQYPCNGKEELEIRERYHIELLKSKLNKTIPTRSKKEYENYNKEKIQDYYKKYRESHKKKMKEYLKQYYIDNKKKLAEQNKENYEANKEIINEKKKEKVICDHCGCEITKTHLKRHQKSNKCINFVK